jgi:hypothetical protein
MYRGQTGGAAALALLTFAIAPHRLLPFGGGRELHWSWWQQAAGDSYALIGLAALTQAAIKNLPPRPKRRRPGTTSTLAAPHDQELGPVRSEARSDASVPARTLIGVCPCAALTQLVTRAGASAPRATGTPKVMGYQPTTKKVGRPDAGSHRREP